ncbi:MAG: iron-sulfur cluster assembly scaffold protein [Sphingomicrobium sp.]
MTAPLYTRDVLRLAASIPHLVRFEEVGEQDEMRSTTCGARVRVSVVMDGERVASLVQAVEACAFGQAAAGLMGADALDKSREEVVDAIGGISAWLAGDDGAVTSWPGLAVLDPARARRGRHGAILLPFRALLAAIEKAK